MVTAATKKSYDKPRQYTKKQRHYFANKGPYSQSESESEVAQSCPTLCDPINCSLPGSSVYGIFQARVLEWVAISFSRGSSQPRDWTRVSRTADRCFTIRATREAHSQSYGFSSCHVWMWELDHKEDWAVKNWCFWTVVLEKTLESLLDCKEVQPVNPKGNQPWIFIGRTDAEAEAPVLWPPDAKIQLIGKDSDAGKDWGQEKWGDRGWAGWMASLTQWTWIWANSGRRWRTEEPGVLQSIGSQRARHDLATEQQQKEENVKENKWCKNKLLLPWMDLESVDSRRRNIIWYPLCCNLEGNDIKELIYNTEADAQT